MTRGPRRLKDDPDFKWETGCDMADEGQVVGGYDHDASRSRLLAAIALLPPVTVGDGVPAVRSGTSAWRAAARPVVGAVAGAMVIAAAYWLGVQAGSETELDSSPAVEQVERSQSVVIEVAPEPSVPAVEAVVPGVATEADPQTRAETLEVSGVAEIEPAVADLAPTVASDGLGTAGTPDVGEPTTSGGSSKAPPAPESDLPKQLDAIEKATEKLEGQDWAGARKGYEQYLQRYPNGKLSVEAQFGLLQAMRGDGDTAGTEALAARIQDLPSFASKREDILRFRAESLVHLNRCDDALLLTEGMSSRLAAEIRRACRQHRE